jgi:hypothetical protein
MPGRLPAHLQQLIQDCPLPDPQDTQRVLDGDLGFGSREYLERASYYGYRGEWWRIWREILIVCGVLLEEALQGLSSKQTAWFAHWALRQDECSDGLLAYRWYLDHRPEVGPPPGDNAIYLDRLLEQHRYVEVLDTVEELEQDGDDLPNEELRAVRALALLGEQPAAMSRLARVRERYHDDGKVWALTAILAAAGGEPAQAADALRECAKLGVYDRDLERELLTAMGLTAEEWQARRAPYVPEHLNYEDQLRKWWADPGAHLVVTSESSCHSYGGDEFHMPACWGCGHAIRQWFALDVREIEPLRERLPSWTLLPLLGCTDCCVWMGRHDYEVRLDTLDVRLVNVGIATQRFGRPVRTQPTIPRQFVRLEWEPPRLNASAEDLSQWSYRCVPQAVGTPFWIQDPLRVYCRSCRQEMTFVAAMGTTYGWEPVVEIFEGLQYHFACDACHTISVIAQWT